MSARASATERGLSSRSDAPCDAPAVAKADRTAFGAGSCGVFFPLAKTAALRAEHGAWLDTGTAAQAVTAATDTASASNSVERERDREEAFFVDTRPSTNRARRRAACVAASPDSGRETLDNDLNEALGANENDVAEAVARGNSTASTEAAASRG